LIFWLYGLQTPNCIRTRDSEATCGQPKGYCDKWACACNAYSHGHRDFYRRNRNKTVDTNRKMTVVTQFVASNGRSDGKLADIKHVYIQDGKVIKSVVAKVGGGLQVDSMTDGYCNATATWTQERGGIEVMSEALARGMALIFSLRADDGGFVNWMDSGNPGPYNDRDTEGNPALIVQHTPDASVTFRIFGGERLEARSRHSLPENLKTHKSGGA
jgi:cellulase